MEHDPMCPMANGCMCEPHPDGCIACDCDCPIIVTVRADEREKAARRVEALADVKAERAYFAALDDAAVAVRMGDAL